MTGYTVHTGASKKFVSGWDNIFTDGTKDNGNKKKKSKKKAAAKVSSKKKGKAKKN